VIFILNQAKNVKLLMEKLPCFSEFSFEKTKQALPPDYLGELFGRNRLPSSCAHCALSDLPYAWTGNLKLSARDWLWLD